MEQVKQQSPKTKKNTEKGQKKSQKIQLEPQMIKKIVTAAKEAVREGGITFANNHKAINGQKVDELRKLIQTNVKSLNYKQIDGLKLFLRSNVEEQPKQEQITDKNCEKGLNPIISQYLILLTIMKEQSVSTPISDAFFDVYMGQWKQSSSITKEDLLSQWKYIPYRNLEKYLEMFQLVQDFQAMKSTIFVKQLKATLTDSKIQQCCEYYKLYRANNINLNKESNSQNLQDFQVSHLLPRLIKSDQIFSSHVIALLKSHPPLKHKFLEEVDRPVGVRVVEALREDVRDYKKIYGYILRQHYRSILSQYKEKWYIVEDKISFSKTFTRWYADQLITDNKLDKFQDFYSEQSVPGKVIGQSILYRANLLKIQKVERVVENPLIKDDHYGNVETILFSKIYHGLQPEDNPHHSKNLYFNLEEEGLPEKSVIMVDTVLSKEFEMLKEEIMLAEKEGKLIGFDTQFRNIESKFDQQGCSILQLCTKDKGFIIDFLRMEKEPKFIDFMIDFVTNIRIKKIGHSIDCDLKELAITFTLPKDRNFQGFIDIAKIYRSKHPASKYSSLSYMCEVLVGKKMSKFQQRSNWIRRPLKKTQIHYGIMDAYACLLCLEKMEGNGDGLKVYHEKNMQKNSAEFYQIIRETDLVYASNYKHLMNKNKTKFLVDNMLKKLCSIMRNIGIDCQYTSQRNYELAIEMAQNEGRVILTKDTKFLSRKYQSVPVYLIEVNGDNQDMFQEVVKKFSLNLNKFSTLSRCVKCNCPDLETITKNQAHKSLSFKHEESEIQDFWRCIKCKQIYWEGNQFQKAKSQYDKLRKQK